ncbi:MAG: hypothetical protein NTZ51_10775 [Proteobacteria bacterium]|nr:hypothetical protein [Pseudomonadota bacterium]
MKVDMSPHAITVRLRRVSQLRRLCLSLGKARFAGYRPEKPEQGGTGRAQCLPKIKTT